MRPDLAYTPCATFLREQTGNIITYAQFEAGNVLTKTLNDAEIGDDDSIMSPLLIEENIIAMDYDDKSDYDLISTEMLEEICDRSQSLPNVNQKEACYKIRDRIRQRQLERKGALKDTQYMDKGLHKVFNTVVKEILKEFLPLRESGSDFSHFIP